MSAPEHPLDGIDAIRLSGEGLITGFSAFDDTVVTRAPLNLEQEARIREIVREELTGWRPRQLYAASDTGRLQPSDDPAVEAAKAALTELLNKDLDDRQALIELIGPPKASPLRRAFRRLRAAIRLRRSSHV